MQQNTIVVNSLYINCRSRTIRPFQWLRSRPNLISECESVRLFVGSISTFWPISNTSMLVSDWIWNFSKPVSSTPLITFGVLFRLKENLDLNFSSIITWWASLIHLILSPLHAGTWHFRQNSWTLSCCVLSFSALLQFSLFLHWVTARSWRSKI